MCGKKSSQSRNGLGMAGTKDALQLKNQKLQMASVFIARVKTPLVIMHINTMVEVFVSTLHG